MVPIKNIFSDDSSDNSASFERHEILQHMSVELEIIEFLASVRVEYHLVILRMKRDKFARHLESMRTDAILEAVCIADDSKKEQCCHLDIYIISQTSYEVIHELTRGTRARIDQIVRSEHAVPVVVVDADNRGISENICVCFRILPYEAQFPAIANKDRIELLPSNLLGDVCVDTEKMKKRCNRKFIDHLDVFPDTHEIEVERHARSVRIAVDTPMPHNEEILTGFDEFSNFCYFLL